MVHKKLLAFSFSVIKLMSSDDNGCVLHTITASYLEIKTEMLFKSHFSEWIGYLPGSFFVLFHSRICLAPTEGCRGERWLGGVLGEKLTAAAMLQSWAWAGGSHTGLSWSQSPHRDFALPFSQQVNNLFQNSMLLFTQVSMH